MVLVQLTQKEETKTFGDLAKVIAEYLEKVIAQSLTSSFRFGSKIV